MPSKPWTLIFVLLNLALCNLAQGAGTQFITGACTSDADCASGCCGFNSGKCAGPVVAQERDGGCGFGDAQPNDNAAQALTGGGSGAGQTAASTAAAAVQSGSSSSSGIDSNAPGAANVGTSSGTQFITGQCLSDADCASGCCGFNSGKCAGAIIAQTRDGGCGFGDAQPNDNAAQALTGGAATATSTAAADAGTGSGSGSDSGSGAFATVTAAASTASINSAAPGAANVGTGSGTQFITGQCLSDADCASGCCGFNSGKCAGAIIAQTRDGGCGFGDAQPNDNAAQALTGSAQRRSLKRAVNVQEFMA
ncbi:hypothetical protein HRR83_000547 [Exophiala dermatitidis]|uniref:Biotrophy-associated secreted protein 2 n=2 Tax=Exophiala dermatitidis TaxID=5970 RepID=H6C9R4_EXODN|nr:uncharacterized protein HMPREF1120_08724 [Exophiala dermatitidis NIH/UT8656]KAJ4524907.1 hypothetical protein HRR75_000498 [Exophiala dermatitidis]EHY60780.1 hypothetical protein HMPREF1120_08724 [Exophiala dermatitidis NIH/UT8656]KAJ4527793.1 hypothetical protein HRR74_000548 [Exophiala dermatitidis]KAJ4528429.1 hypothetical protein HRR73_001052 [Exophiala dermatitidis]KAJ4531387.1 hypothetical protein HRR76_009046 [Exophiala dermatitidis]